MSGLGLEAKIFGLGLEAQVLGLGLGFAVPALALFIVALSTSLIKSKISQ